MLKIVFGCMYDFNCVKDEESEYFVICICYKNGCFV